MRRVGLGALAKASILLLICAATTAASHRPYVSLGGYWIDQHKKYGWAFFAERPGPPEGTGPHGARRPCISVAAAERLSRGELRVSESGFCYGYPHYLTAKAEPLVVAKTVFANEKGSATAFGVAASPAARELKLTLGSGYRTVHLRELNRVQARKVRLRPFRYAAFVMRGEWCIEQIVVLNRAGNPLWDSGSQECPS